MRSTRSKGLPSAISSQDAARRSIGKARGGDGEITVDGDAAAHLRHAQTLREEAAAKAAAADDAGFNRPSCRGEIIEMVHAFPL